MKMWQLKIVVTLAALASCVNCKSGLQYKVKCSEDLMEVELIKSTTVKEIHLQHLKQFPDPACKPKITGNLVTFQLKLSNIYQCMLQKIVNKQTNSKLYYHRVIVEYEDDTPKEAIVVKCNTGISAVSNSSEVESLSIVKRQVDFGPGFREDDVEITSEVTGFAPAPLLNVGVRQAGVLIDDELNVKPGTPLNMEVYLDNASKDVYGLLVSGMDVTDTQSQTEPILVNGCSVDPYLFENFVSVDGDFLKAKFRAFKFPDSNYVLFKGTVNVCLDSCKGVQCSNGQLGFGRRRRDVDSVSPASNKVYEVSMSTVIKLECTENDCLEIKTTRNKEQILPREEDRTPHVQIHQETAHVRAFQANEEAALSALFEEFKTPGIAVFEKNNAESALISCLSVLVPVAVLLFYRF